MKGARQRVNRQRVNRQMVNRQCFFFVVRENEDKTETDNPQLVTWVLRNLSEPDYKFMTPVLFFSSGGFPPV